MPERERLPLSEWKAEHMRGTAFLGPEAEVNVGRWWQAVVGHDPESQGRRGVMQQAGGEVWDGVNLGLTAQPTRVDWVLSPKRPLAAPSPEFDTVGGFLEIYDRFNELIHRWLDTSPQPNRIAFGTAVLYPVSSLAEGYYQLRPYLHSVNLDAERSTDFLYRINRPRLTGTGIENLSLNRLSSWMVAASQLVIIDPSVQARTLQPMLASRIELDMSSQGDFGRLFSPGESVRLFDELMDLSREIVQEGDIP